MSTVLEHTVTKKCCVGCGICAASCPMEAIGMSINAYQEYVPRLDADKCTRCATCVACCPNTDVKRTARSAMLKDSPDPESRGLENARYFLAWDANDSNREKSASGGVISALAMDLLDRGVLSGVLHAHALCNPAGEPHFAASLSVNSREVHEKRGSFYAPLDFSNHLRGLMDDKPGAYLCIGTPCVISGIAALRGVNEKLRKKKLFTIALMCSHTVNGQFTDFLAASMGISPATPYRVNLRAKDASMPDANNYYTEFSNESGLRKKKNRFQSLYTKYWRSYAFSSEACLRCMDFWGDDADMSVKDAWGRWAADRLGKSIVVVRNPVFGRFLEEQANVRLEPLSYEDVRHCQEGATHFKLASAHVKRTKAAWAGENRKNGLLRYVLNARYSKWVFRHFGWRALHLQYAALDGVRGLFAAARRAFRPARTKKRNILILGGYGFGNTGDEAQLATVLRNIRTLLPEYMATVLTPNMEYTHFHHQCMVSDAPRVSFYDHDLEGGVYRAPQERFGKVRFLLRSLWIYLNALLDVCGLPVLLRPKRAHLLREIQTASLIYFSGGGYLTGPTLSRFWDGCFFILLAKLYRIPVVLSGQTMGMFQTPFNKWLAKKAFAYPRAITLRDPESSLRDLREIGVTSATVMFDDALFCEKMEADGIVDSHLEKCGISGNEKYVCLHMHYWGMNSDDERRNVRDRIATLCSLICGKANWKILLIPMVNRDEEAIADFYKEYRGAYPVKVFAYDYDFRVIRSVIARSELCVTMKHHPIIFAVGEKVPVISLNYAPYYHHKNSGALAIFGLERFAVPLDSDACLPAFRRALDETLEGRERIIHHLDALLPRLKSRQDEFYAKVREILDGGGGHPGARFPFHKIPVGSRVVIYGAGQFGCAYYKQALASGRCDIVLVVDRDYAERDGVRGIRVRPIEDIRNVAYDYVVLAVKSGRLREEMTALLLCAGVPPEKIVDAQS